jgi:hypothetical protein
MIVYCITSVSVLFIFVHCIHLENNLFFFCSLVLNRFNVIFRT